MANSKSIRSKQSSKEIEIICPTCGSRKLFIYHIQRFNCEYCGNYFKITFFGDSFLLNISENRNNSLTDRIRKTLQNHSLEIPIEERKLRQSINYLKNDLELIETQKPKTGGNEIFTTLIMLGVFLILGGVGKLVITKEADILLIGIVYCLILVPINYINSSANKDQKNSTSSSIQELTKKKNEFEIKLLKLESERYIAEENARIAEEDEISRQEELYDKFKKNTINFK
jgi:hypothetical protein